MADNAAGRLAGTGATRGARGCPAGENQSRLRGLFRPASASRRSSASLSLPGLCARHRSRGAAGAECDQVLEAMNGHVLAAGELVGTFQQGTADARSNPGAAHALTARTRNHSHAVSRASPMGPQTGWRAVSLPCRSIERVHQGGAQTALPAALRNYGERSRMKIAQVAPLVESVPPKLYGGTERIVSYLTEELVRQGHDVTLFASGDSVTKAELHAVVPTALRLNPAHQGTAGLRHAAARGAAASCRRIRRDSCPR